MGNRFEKKTVLIENKDVLRDDWQPQELVERESEMDEYASTLQPVIQGWQPSNVFIYGVTGAGKTAATRALTRELLEASSSLTVIELNCTSMKSSYQVAINLVNECRKPSHRLTHIQPIERPTLSQTGYPQKRVFNELYRDIEEIGGTILFVLDEIDNIGSDDDILYELPRARTTHNISAKLGVIGISNDFNFRDNLSPKVKDTLCEEEILFTPYDADSLRSILSRRVKKAFVDTDVIPNGVIALCAAYATQDSGSARQALRILRKSAETVEREVRKGNRTDITVSEDDVKEAHEQLQRKQVIQGMNELTKHGQLVLLAVCTRESDLPVRTKEIHKTYTEIAKQYDTKPLKRRRVHDHLSDLQLHGILTQVEKSDGRGNYNMYELNVSIESAINALQTNLNSVNI